jgi:D-alanyl-lipoteichoic acid acyltransferase DltB (MBOAT superfamily)
MLFNSYIFIFVFLPIAALGFALLGRVGQRLTLSWLAICSLAFYGYWHPPHLLLIGASIVVNYACGAGLGRWHATRWRRPLLYSGAAFNLGLLGYYKYAGFFATTFNGIAGTSLPVLQLALPLGISFFTFQQIAFLVDASQGLTKNFRPVDYVLFVTFFPQLIAGPIVHHRDLLDQFTSQRTFRFRAQDVAAGLTIFVIGLFKKVMLADSVAGYANRVFDAAAAGVVPTSQDSWYAALAYAFQLYFDFSGYSDMAVGLGGLFGIRIPVNFNSPYKAVHIAEFWRRWHMTLSQFLRDYLYIPLGGSRCGPARSAANLMITMLLGGLWHGAGWTFVIWGGFHGLLLAGHRIWLRTADQRGWGWRDSRGWRWVSTAATFLCVLAGWVLFRAADLPTAGRMLGGLTGLASTTAPRLTGSRGEVILTLLALAAITWLMPNTQEFVRTRFSADQLVPGLEPEGSPRWVWRASAATGVVMALLFVCAVTYLTRVREFLYFQF